MRRFHVHIAVEDFDQSRAFYSRLFGPPSLSQADYAKWMLEDPKINFAISARGHPPGVNHLGIQVESDDDLRQLRSRLVAADPHMVSEGKADCCYATADKYWVTDPNGIAWETFHTLGDIPTFGRSRWDEAPAPTALAPACCAKGKASAPAGSATAAACCELRPT